MANTKTKKYEFRYEVASERNKIPGYILTPKSNRSVETQLKSEHETLQEMQRSALKGELAEVRKQLLEFPEFKREDLKKMLIDSVAEHGRTLEL
ncbi:MAG: hypothetical protein H8E38_04130 [SAR324 cluster bacterium]|nr:hypothetical protein [SAR324 cluster bacterium]MBL7035278.1 hypothetical protein [SAR324 cluster bacterium]